MGWPNWCRPPSIVPPELGPAGPSKAGDGARLAVAFCRVLRAAGLATAPGQTILFAEALGAAGLAQPRRVYAAASAALLRRPEDRAIFDRCFAAYFTGTAGPLSPEPDVPGVCAGPDLARADSDGDAIAGPTWELRFSPAEVLRHRDFAQCTPEELAEVHRAVRLLAVAGPWRPGRRRRAAARGRPDLRRTVSASLRTGGDPLELARKDTTDRQRNLVLLVDVSGSMGPYLGPLLRFAHAAASGRRRVEVFAVGTRLTRLTRALATHDPDLALTRAGATVADWEGGTRLGAGIAAFNEQFGVRGMARGAAMVILSDGWDRGDLAEMTDAMRRLRRVAHQVVWVNPLVATPGYAPLAGGMAAALPYVDALVPGHDLAALEALARRLGEATAGEPQQLV